MLAVLIKTRLDSIKLALEMAGEQQVFTVNEVLKTYCEYKMPGVVVS